MSPSPEMLASLLTSLLLLAASAAPLADSSAFALFVQRRSAGRADRIAIAASDIVPRRQSRAITARRADSAATHTRHLTDLDAAFRPPFRKPFHIPRQDTRCELSVVTIEVGGNNEDELGRGGGGGKRMSEAGRCLIRSADSLP